MIDHITVAVRDYERSARGTTASRASEPTTTRPATVPVLDDDGHNVQADCHAPA